MDLFWLMVLEPGKSRGRGLQCIWYMVGGGTSGYMVTLWKALCGEAEDTPALPPFPTYLSASSSVLPPLFLPLTSSPFFLSLPYLPRSPPLLPF